MTSGGALVIGAGIVGVCAALALQARGLKVRLVDAGRAGQGCSFGNAGVITPSAFALTASAPFAKLPWLVLSRRSPVSLHWPSMAALWPWFTHYVRASASEHVSRDSETLHRLAADALPAYERLLGHPPRQLRRRGYLAVHFTAAERAAAARSNASRRDFGVRTQDLSAAESMALEPAIGRLGVGATYVEAAAHVPDPAKFVQALFEEFLHRGGSYECDHVARLERQGDGQTRVIGRTRTRVVATAIIAAGSRSNDLLRPLGLDIPLVAERGYHIDLAPSAPAVSRPVALPSFGVVLSPTDHGTRLVGLSHFGRPGFAARPSLLSSALKRLQVQLPQLEPDEHGAIWSGERPATPDSLPVVDRVARFHGLFVCTGHGHTGLTLAAATAGLLADLVCGDTHELHSRLAISRFRRRAPA